MTKYDLWNVRNIQNQGRERVNDTIKKQSPPAQFRQTMKLIHIPTTATNDNKNTKRKDKKTAERSRTLKRLDALNLIWFVIAYPKAIWSGGRTAEVNFLALVRPLMKPLVKPQDEVLTELILTVWNVLVDLKQNDLSESQSFYEFFTGQFDN